MLALVSVLVALHLSGCEKNAAVTLAAVKARIARSEGAAAEIDLKNFIQRHPDSGEARYLLGLLAQKRGDSAAALIELQRALDLKHPDSIVVPAIAKTLLAQGKFKQVTDEFGKTEFSDRVTTAELQGLVAQAMHFDGDTQGASERINKAAAAAPASESVLLAKASFAGQAGSVDQALEVLNSLITRVPNSHAAWTMKGNLLGFQPGKADLAMEAFRKALAINPSEIAPHTGLIALSIQRGDLAGAQRELDALMKVAPKQINTQYYEANLAYATGKYTIAQSLYQEILRVLPLNPAVLLSAAENELRLNATAQAETLAAKALTQAPNDLRARQVLAQVYLRTGQPDKAIATLSSMIEGPRAPAEVLALSAQAHLMNGNLAAAEQLYERIAKLNPTDPRLRTLLATASLGKSGNDQGFDTLASISDDDKGIAADLAIVSARLRARQFDEAIKAVETVIKKQPDQALGYQLKAQVLAQRNDLPGAQQALKTALTKDATYLPAVLGLATLEMREHKPGLAKARVEELLKKQPKNARALVALAELGVEAGLPPAVVLDYLDRAVKIDPTDSAIWAALIDQQVSYGNLRASLVSSQAAVASNPKDVGLLDRLGRAQFRNGQADLALITYGKLTSLNSKSLVGLLGQIEVLIATSHLAEASRMVTKVLERDPQNLLAQTLGFGIALQQRQYKSAVDAARRLQRQLPADAVGFKLEAEAEAQQGRRDPAIELLRHALTLNRPGNAPTRLHQALLDSGKGNDATAMADTWLKSHPNDLDMLLHLASSNRKQGRADAAEARYRQLLVQRSNHVVALNDLAMLLAKQGKPEAVTLAEQALKFAPENPTVLDTLAQALAGTNQLGKALEVQKRAVLLAPTEPALRLNQAKLEFQSGDKTAAKRSLDGLLDQSGKLNAEDRAVMATMAKALNPG